MRKDIYIDSASVGKVSKCYKVKLTCRKDTCNFIEIISVCGNAYKLRGKFYLTEVKRTCIVTNFSIENCTDGGHGFVKRLNADS